ncbi:hypothetical protein [Motilimonas sp. E26]|uniref:hypothetical protein n=1 Tax=Motilimonas sp. E26 TaxID=2865674 RepID=UPI001E2B52DD|nr:hypothetical protein [Motilimonas sp. E26]MCE0556858.1 hypothetical protein [Motilimonas sp. E26]
MLDMQGILKEYRPLQMFSVDVCEKSGDEYIEYLNEYNFTWQPEPKDGGIAQLFTGEEPLTFHGKRSDPLAVKALKAKLGNNPLRLPVISFCWGQEQSIMLSNKIADDIYFSPILGVTRTPATIIDATKQTRSGYTVFSFHKVFSYARVESRLADVPVAQRLMIRIQLTAHKSMYLVHQSLLTRWQAAGVTELAYDFDNQSLNLKQLIKKGSYTSSAGYQTFDSLADYQKCKLT